MSEIDKDISTIEIIKELCLTLFKVLYYIVESWCRFFYSPRKDLKGEIVVLTGAAGDLGKLLSKKLTQKGCTLILLDINMADLLDHTTNLNALSDSKQVAYAYKCDVTNENEVECVYSEILKDVGHPTMLINNAAIVTGEYFQELSQNNVNKAYNINVLSHYRFVKLFLPHMMEQNHGHIICMASILGTSGVAGVADYGPSKAAAIIYMQSLRQEIRMLGKDNVHCTTVLPYQVKAKMFNGCAVRFAESPVLSRLDPDYLIEKVVSAIEKNQITLYVPKILYLAVFMLSFLPDKAYDALMDFNRVNEAMKTFYGRQKKEN